VSLYYDSSVLGSLYVREESSQAITRFLASRAESVAIHEVHEIEIKNAFRLKRSRGEIDDVRLAAALGWLAEDLAAGRLIRRCPDWQSVFAEAERLSAKITANQGLRTLDLIHIAAAFHQSASGLVSNDSRQRDTASAAGLQVVNFAG